LLRSYFPYLSSSVIAALHVRRAGWFSAQQLGAYLLQQARRHGARLSPVQARVTGVKVSSGKPGAARLPWRAMDHPRDYAAISLMLPVLFLPQVGRLLGLELPVYNELHLKVALHDALGVSCRATPRS
jgi:sarcosine oxidase, subunit beta